VLQAHRPLQHNWTRSGLPLYAVDLAGVYNAHGLRVRTGLESALHPSRLGSSYAGKLLAGLFVDALRTASPRSGPDRRAVAAWRALRRPLVPESLRASCPSIAGALAALRTLARTYSVLYFRPNQKSGAQYSRGEEQLTPWLNYTARRGRSDRKAGVVVPRCTNPLCIRFPERVRAVLIHAEGSGGVLRAYDPASLSDIPVRTTRAESCPLHSYREYFDTWLVGKKLLPTSFCICQVPTTPPRLPHYNPDGPLHLSYVVGVL